MSELADDAIRNWGSEACEACHKPLPSSSVHVLCRQCREFRRRRSGAGMKRVSRTDFLEHLNWVCEQAKFHNFVVQVTWSNPEWIDVTVPQSFDIRANCVGKRHEFIFTAKKGAK